MPSKERSYFRWGREERALDVFATHAGDYNRMFSAHNNDTYWNSNVVYLLGALLKIILTYNHLHNLRRCTYELQNIHFRYERNIPRFEFANSTWLYPPSMHRIDMILQLGISVVVEPRPNLPQHTAPEPFAVATQQYPKRVLENRELSIRRRAGTD